MKQLGAIIFVLFVSLGFTPLSVQAADFRNADEVIVAASETVDGSLFAAGSTITIDGAIDGDLFCAGQDIRISGFVNGDVFCAGQSIDIVGDVTGSVRVAGQKTFLANTIGRNVMVLGQMISFSPETVIQGEVYIAGQDIDIAGSVGRDLTVWAQQLAVADEASVSGNFFYGAERSTIAPSATVSGTIRREEIKHEKKPSYESKSPSWYAHIWRILLAVGVTLLVAVLFPKKTMEMVSIMENTPGRALGVGTLALLVMPVILLFLVITIIGIPVALLGGMAWILLVLLSRVFVAVFVGSAIMRYASRHLRDSLPVKAVTGAAVLWILFIIPGFGWIFSLFAIILGTGSIVHLFMQKSSKK